ncbi:MAG: OB-fold domain-containing protein [Candidatus Gottesmanbacteria bacterium]|nr:OB-fold domain-containing protein [Candidatus Gottesmanbacteria bacterium]
MISPVKLWRNQKKIAELVGKTGVVISFTVIRVPPADFTDQAPYPVALVQLDRGERITAQMVDWEEKHLVIGTPVITIVRRVMSPSTDGVIPYGIKVKPLEK